MPRFKSNANIFVYLDDHYDRNHYDSNIPFIPETKKWTYDREMTIDDVDLWEVIIEEGGGRAVYASYVPYAEFYMICTGWKSDGKTPRIETYYGPGAESVVQKRMKELDFPVVTNKVWIDNDDMWLHI